MFKQESLNFLCIFWSAGNVIVFNTITLVFEHPTPRMSIRITKGSYTSTIDSTSLSANRTITIPNASGTLALTGQFATVATTGSYNDLSNRPALKTVATSGAYNDLSGKPTLAKVATSGSYNDLSNKPSIPSTPQGYITQTWHSGSNWYRVWSDGFIEQGGVVRLGGSNPKTIPLNHKFSNTNYVVGGTREERSNQSWTPAYTGDALCSITTTSFKTGSAYDWGDNLNYRWSAYRF